MRDKIVKVAEGELGVCEPSGDDKYIKHWNKVGGTQFALTVAWCAIFVTWCKAMAGIATSIIPNFASCDVGKQWFEKKGQYKLAKAFGGTYTPVKGDIIFFSSKKTQADSTHVGIVTGVSGGKVNTIEGNTSNKVARRSYALNNKTILGYGVPAYTVSTGTSSKPTASVGSVSTKKVDSAKYKEDGHGKGTKLTTKTDLNMRVGAGAAKAKIKVLEKGAKVTWYGYYSNVNGTKWYLVIDATGTKGFVSSKYLV